MDAEEGGDRTVDPRQFQRDETRQQRTAAGAAKPFIADAGDVQFLDLGDQIEGEITFGPIFLDDRRDLDLGEGADAVEDRPLVFGHSRPEAIEIGVRRRELLLLMVFRHDSSPLLQPEREPVGRSSIPVSA
jgi:hypothetical protein